MTVANSVEAKRSSYQALKARAEKLFSEGSFRQAHSTYLKAKNIKLSGKDKRWVEFRIADTLWREQNGSQTSDLTKYEQAKQALEILVRDIKRDEEKDRLWVEVQESLGDFYWTRKNNSDWYQAWQYYQQALDWWAGAKDIELARDRYIKILKVIAEPVWAENYYYYGYYGNMLPLEMAENYLQIAKTSQDRAQAQYLIAMTLKQGGQQEMIERVPEAFEAALKFGKATDWYDVALYQYAQWLESYGQRVLVKTGGWNYEPDYSRALKFYRRLIKEFKKGESQYYEYAKERIKDITGTSVGIYVANIFLPDSEIQCYLNWRNQKQIKLGLYRVDLSKDVIFKKNYQTSDWIRKIRLSKKQLVKKWTKATKTKAYVQGQETININEKLPVGAYVIEVSDGKHKARDMILVTDTTLVVKTSGKQALVYYCSVIDGSPIAGASISFQEQRYQKNKYVWKNQEKVSNKDGLAVFDFTHKDTSEIFVAANLNGRQAFSTGYVNHYSDSQVPWKIYAFTDRPAYRPGEKVHWKMIARQVKASGYSTPAEKTIDYKVLDPRNSKVKSGSVKLNQFGSGWGELKLDEKTPLGEYKIQFYDKGQKNYIGSATLFRLEEYKLPEFKVQINTSKENGKPKLFKVGDTVEASIEAEYYFGGPVANATVEVIVYQNPFYQSWQPRRQYPWFYEDMQPYGYNAWGNGQIIKQAALKTNALGKAVVSFPTPRNSGQDYEYRIEARVKDSSRREIVASDKVRVTQKSYAVYLNAEHALYRPQDKIKLLINAIDSNDQPVLAKGKVKVTRDRWVEVWLDEKGRAVRKDNVKLWGAHQPGGKSNQAGWTLKFQGYEHDEILEHTVKTNEQGEAELDFIADKEGYYRIAWESDDEGNRLITAETTVWTASQATNAMGYHHGGIGIILDKDTVQIGKKTPIMLTAPFNDSYILFSVEGEDLYNYQLLHLTGNVKLVELMIEEKHVPNIFLGAAMVSERQLYVDSKQVIVPPEQHFLNIKVESDKTQYQPQEEGQIKVTAVDHTGKPVVAEIGLSLFDESLTYIQQDYAGDPRPFYFGSKRQNTIQTDGTLQQKPYTLLVKNPITPGEVVTREEFDCKRRDHRSKPVLRMAGASGQFDGKSADSEIALSQSMPASAPPRETKSEPFIPSKKSSERVTRKVESQKSLIEQEPAVQVRHDFKSTVLWQPDVITGADGTAKIKVNYPDSLTTWKAVARAATISNQFGIADADAKTTMPLMIRLQAPRFFLVRDKVVVSAIINNNTDSVMTVIPDLIATGIKIKKGGPKKIRINARSEARIDWQTEINKPGVAKLKVIAKTKGKSKVYADAMEKSYPIYEHGIEKFVSLSGKTRNKDTKLTLSIPKERKPESTILKVQVAPSLAVTMLDAIPYLIDFPYGCTEQTLSRFLPAVIVAKTLKDIGIKPASIAGKLFGGIEQVNNGKTYTQPKQNADQLNKVVNKGLERLNDFQHSDGGWGWWKDGVSDNFMTAYVVWGLQLAKKAGSPVKLDVLNRGFHYLDGHLIDEENNYDRQAWMLHALASVSDIKCKHYRSAYQKKAFNNLWKKRNKLNAYTRSLLALSAHYYDYHEQAMTLIRNLENGIVVDSQPDKSVLQKTTVDAGAEVMATAHWGEDGVYWRWSEGGVEATAFGLRALMAIDPKNKLVEPVMNWLIKNRRGAQWSNTRDTSITILALNDYLKISRELKEETAYSLSVNGNRIVSKHLKIDELVNAPSQFIIDPRVIRDGANEIKIQQTKGKGHLYFAAQAGFYSLEEPISAEGNELFVKRQYYKFVGRPTLLKGYVYDKVPLSDGEKVKSGERIETVVTVEAKNNYEYLIVEDLKPAGIEAVQIRSGEPLYARQIKSGAVKRLYKDKTKKNQSEQQDTTGQTVRIYQELRDNKIALFIDKLDQGIWEIRYFMRAEVPGSFHALPVIGHAMYVPEIRCNGNEVRIKVKD